jgi:hypothetical protein
MDNDTVDRCDCGGGGEVVVAVTKRIPFYNLELVKQLSTDSNSLSTSNIFGDVTRTYRDDTNCVLCACFEQCMLAHQRLAGSLVLPKPDDRPIHFTGLML